MKFSFLEHSFCNVLPIIGVSADSQNWLSNWLTYFPISSHLPIFTVNHHQQTWLYSVLTDLPKATILLALSSALALDYTSFVLWCRMITSGKQSMKQPLTTLIIFMETEDFKTLFNLLPSMFLTIESPKIKFFFFFSKVFLSIILLMFWFLCFLLLEYYLESQRYHCFYKLPMMKI